MKFLLSVLIITIFTWDFYGQNEVSQKLYSSLKGKWVKTSGDKDTLEFGKYHEKMCTLTKQFGTRPPKDPEGSYDFKLTPKGVYLQWMAASSMIFNKSPYFFKLDTLSKTLIIGNFYANPKDIKLLYFKKVNNLSSLK